MLRTAILYAQSQRRDALDQQIRKLDGVVRSYRRRIAINRDDADHSR